MRRYRVDIFKPSVREKGYWDMDCGYGCGHLEEAVGYIKRFQKDNPTFVPPYPRDVFLDIMEERDKNNEEVLMNFYFTDQNTGLPMYGKVIWCDLDD